MELRLLFVVAVQVLIFNQVWSRECDPYKGPPGKTRCISLEGYIGYQWATCLSNDYIMQRSKNRHICQSMHSGFIPVTPDFCWYQCQIEIYYQERGIVTGQCECDPMDDAKNKVALGNWCLSPDGTECFWYKECLKKKHPCPGSGLNHILAHNARICNLYSRMNNIGYFSNKTAVWLNAAKKCLQVALVPFLRLWASPACHEIKDKAIESHSQCYMNPFPEAPSICDLGCLEWAKFFWNVGHSSHEALKATVAVMMNCGEDVSILGPKCPSKMFRLKLNYYGPKYLPSQDAMSIEIGRQLAKRLKWNTRPMDWFAFAPNMTTNPGNSSFVTVDIIVGDKIALGRSQVKRSQFNFENVARDFGDSLEGGYLYDLRLKYGKASVYTMEDCMNQLCDQTFMNATAGPQANAATKIQIELWMYAMLTLTALVV